MTDPLKPTIALLAKLGSIIVHVEEAASSDAHAFDFGAFHTLRADHDVQEWVEGMQRLALVPAKRKP